MENEASEMISRLRLNFPHYVANRFVFTSALHLENKKMHPSDFISLKSTTNELSISSPLLLSWLSFIHGVVIEH